MGAIEEVKEYFKAMLDNLRIEDVFVYDGNKYKYIKLDTVEHILTMNKDICEIIRRNNEERGTM